MEKRSFRSVPARLALLALAMLGAALLSLCLGAAAVSPREILSVLSGGGKGTTAASILLYVRLPRTLGCLLAGAALAVSGAVIQTVLANPLAAPNIIGVNSGAGLGVALCCAVLPTAAAAVPFAAFLGAFAGVMLVLLISEKAGASRMTLVLAGVAISGMFGAGIDAVLTVFPDSLIGYSDFRIGGLANLSMGKVAPAAWVILLCLGAALALANEMDVLALGADTARSLGLRVRGVRVALLALAAALAGAAVSFAGLLGFVGLVAPHMVRRLVGGESRRLLAGCALAAITLSMVVAPSAAEPIALYRPVIPAMVAGLILLLLLPAPYRFLGAGLVIMGVYCLDMFMMLVSTDVAFRGRIPVALSFGLVILCARTGTLIGSFAADQLLNAALWSEALRSEVFLVGVLALVLVGMLFFTQTDVQKLYATSREETADASLEQKCAAIARMCRLTNREAEVLVLLARGRTVRYICDELSIAQGTAKHHVSNIYRKVGVFDRQGLLDTIEQGGVGKPGWE